MGLSGLRTLSRGRLAAVRAAVFVLCLAPAAALVAQGLTDRLGAEPIDRITDETGEAALRMLVATLAVTPARRLTGWNWLLRLRRMLGLYAFFYALLHFGTYVLLDRGLDLSTVVEDVLDRRFITAGFAAFVLLWPLALTSTAWAVRRMGAGRWLALHRSVYAIAALACVHFLWLVRGDDMGEPVAYAAVFAALLLFRWVWWRRARAGGTA